MSVVDFATTSEPCGPDPKKDLATVILLDVDKARAEKLSAEKRSTIAMLTSHSRYSKTN